MEKEINNNNSPKLNSENYNSSDSNTTDNYNDIYTADFVSKIPEEKNTTFVEIITSSSIFKYFLGAMIIFGVCFISCLFVFNIIMSPIGVIGYSMLPTINAVATGDKGDVKTDSVYYMKSETYSYKDIVIIKGGKTDSGDMIIKRVVACPGQTITFIKTGERLIYAEIYFEYDVYINGKLLYENYIFEQDQKVKYVLSLDSEHYQYYVNFVKQLRATGEFSQTLGKNEYFVMGDNRNNSTDSRWFGPVDKNYILGKVVLHIEYGNTLFNAILESLFNMKFYKIY